MKITLDLDIDEITTMSFVLRSWFSTCTFIGDQFELYNCERLESVLEQIDEQLLRKIRTQEALPTKTLLKICECIQEDGNES